MPLNRTAALRKLHLVGRDRGFDHDALRDLAGTMFELPAEGRSLASLTDSQLAALLDSLAGRALTTTAAGRTYAASAAPRAPKPAGPVAVRGGATDRQVWLIRQLATQLGMDSNADRLPGFIRRQTGGRCHRVEDLKVWQAGKVIEGLKRLIAKAASAAQ